MPEGLELKRVEYRVKPVTRYIVTKCENWGTPQGDKDERKVTEIGEHLNADVAWEIAYALAKQMHEMIGWPPGDERITYPIHPNNPNAIPESTYTDGLGVKAIG